MGDDTEYIKLPLLQRCTHKLWKARVHGYTEAAKCFQEEEDEKAAIFVQFVGLVSKFVSDTHAAAQEKGLEATLYFVQNSSVAGKTVKDVMSAIIAKSIAAPKKSTQDLSLQIALMYIEIEKQEAVVEELVKGLEHKNPKIVAACLSALTSSLREFGAQVVSIKPLIKPMQTLLEDRDKTVREETKALVVEIYRWIGEAIKPQLSKLKPIQLSELEVEFGKVKGEKAVPIRYLRSQQAKQAKAQTGRGEDGVENSDETTGEVEVDPLSLVDPINVLSKIPNDLYEKLEAKKWQERKEAVENLDKILDYPKFEKGEYGDLVRALMKVVTKDSNVVVVGIATKCIARLASGLKKGFHVYASATLPQLLAKFKEKKANVVAPLREAVDAIYPSTTLEAIQEDVIASLDNKNPSIKAETAAFLGRCFTQCTPTILNKKVLKPFASALLKALNESDPGVRDSSAEALGIAMKVVGEKVLQPFLPDIDPLKLAKIKEFCDKAVVKTVTVKAAPKAEPLPVKADAPKKVLSGGAIRAQAPKEQKTLVAEKGMSAEEIDEKAAELLPEDVLKNLADANWKQRLEGIELFQNILMSMDSSEVAAEVMTKVLMKKPGMKDNNFQVMKLKLDCLKFIAESWPIAKNVAESVVADVTEKLSDPKNGTLAGETLMALTEVTNLDIVGSAVLEFAFSQKSVKVQQEALDWIGEAIQNFGFIIQSKTVIDYLKKGLNSTNSGVRQSAATLGGIVHLYLGPQLIQRLDEKPAAVALLTTEIEKHAGEEALEPSRSCKIPKEPEPVNQPKAQKSHLPPSPKQEHIEEEDDEEKEEKKPAQRLDISPKLTEKLLADLQDKDWKVRNDALLNLQAMLADVKIKSNLGELPPILVQRFVDSNSKLVATALEVCTALATAMGPGSKNHVRTFSRGIFLALGDNKQWVRSAALTCLNTWAAEVGAKEFFSGEVIPDVLKTGSAALRIEIWTWLGEILVTAKGLPKDELCLIIPHLFAALEDRNVDVRKAGNNAVLGVMTHVGYHNMIKEVDKLKPSSKAGIIQILDKVRPDVPEIETRTSGKPKPDVKGKTPLPKQASAPKARASMAPVSAKPVARKKEEEIDTSPLLLVNKLKYQRGLDEQKLKTIKWNFTTPRPEYVELLKDQVTVAGFNKNLVSNMFHSDFKFHIKAIESLIDDLGNEEALIANLDLILKWLTLRFFDTNPSVLLKGLEYLHSAFNILIDRKYAMMDLEANSFIPYLVMKIGDPKDAVRDRVHSLLRQFSLMHSPGKLFILIMDQLKSKNSRLRTECLDELGYLIEQFGTSVCMPSLAVALKEISKQISDRDNSVRSAALNAIVKAYFVEGEKIYKLIGKLSDKDMSYLEERIKRASQNRTKMIQDVTRIQPEIRRNAPEPEPVDEYSEEPEPEPVVEPAPPTPAPAPVYVPENPPAFQYKRIDLPSTRLSKIDIIEIDDSFLDEPIHIPESIRMKMQKQIPTNPLVEEVIRNVASENIHIAIEGAGKLHVVLTSEVGDKLEPYSKGILDALTTQLKYANSYSFAMHGSTLGQLYKIILRNIDDIFSKKTPVGQNADDNHLKGLIHELLVCLVEEKTIVFQEGGYNQFIVVLVSRIIEFADTTSVACASVNALNELVGRPPSNMKLVDLTTKCLLKVVVLIRRANDLDALLNLDKVLYTCHLFMQAYPRYTWKDRPTDVPLKAVKTLLVNLVAKKGPEILTHMRSIENPISSELSGYLKKMIKQQPNASKSANKLTKAQSDHLSEVFKKIANEGTRDEGLVQLYEFKKQHPDVDLSALLAPTTSFFKEYVAEGLRQIEKERGPLKKAPEMTPSKIESTPISAPDPPSDSKLLPQYYLDKLRMFQQRLGLPVSNLPDFEPYNSPTK